MVRPHQPTRHPGATILQRIRFLQIKSVVALPGSVHDSPGVTGCPIPAAKVPPTERPPEQLPGFVLHSPAQLAPLPAFGCLLAQAVASLTANLRE
jgi:hypothetical protein